MNAKVSIRVLHNQFWWNSAGLNKYYISKNTPTIQGKHMTVDEVPVKNRALVYEIEIDS